jgi:Rhs element Vgr protein
MPVSPAILNDPQITYSVLIGGAEKGDYLVVSIEVSKEVNKIPYGEVVFEDGSPRTPKKNFLISSSADLIPGKEIEIKAGYGSTLETIFKGIVVSHRIRIKAAGPVLVVRCYDKAIAMTVGRKNTYFEKKKDNEIIKEVVTGTAGLSATIKATKEKHKMMIQYHATDWDFMLARAEANGFIVLTDQGKLDIGPPKTSGSGPLIVTYGESLINCDLDIDAKSQYASVSCHAWDHAQQKMVKGDSAEPTVNAHGNLKGKTIASDIGVKKPAEFHTSGPVSEVMLKEWANAKLLKSRLAMVNGSITFPGSAKAKPGEILELAGLGDRLNGKAFISRVRHIISRNGWETTATIGLSPEWFLENKTDGNTPAAGGLLPAVHGLQIGVVQQIEKDPDGEFRILVDVPVIAPSGEGIWARMTHFYATEDAGLFFMPEVKDEVLLGFINNDPRFPVILGMAYSGKRKAPYQADKKNNIKALVTKSKMKIEFEEEKKIITIETPGGNKIIMDDDKKSISLLDANKNKLILNDKGITLDTPKDITMKAKGKIMMQATAGIEIKCKGGDVKTEGINVELKGKMAFKGQAPMVEVKGSATVDIQGSIVTIN